MGLFRSEPTGLAPIPNAVQNLGAASRQIGWGQVALIGQFFQDPRIRTGGLPAFTIQKDVVPVMQHAAAAIQYDALPRSPRVPTVKPDLCLGFGQPFAQSALGIQRTEIGRAHV